MADVSELLAAEADRLQPRDLPPFEELVRLRGLRDRRNRMASGAATLLAVAGIAVAATSLGADRSAGDASTLPPAGVTSTSPAAGPATARLSLSATSARAGDSVAGVVTVENQTGRPLRVTGCGSIYQVMLVGGDQRGAPASLACRQVFTIPEGQSTYPVQVRATYDSCADAESAHPCPGDGRLPPLPQGEYAATTFPADQLAPVPEPVPFTVLP